MGRALRHRRPRDRELVARRADGSVACPRCRVADRPLARLRGLLGRAALEPGEGLLITPTGSVHTCFMRFPIDVVFLDRDGAVLGVRADLRPWRASGRRGARCPPSRRPA